MSDQCHSAPRPISAAIGRRELLAGAALLAAASAAGAAGGPAEPHVLCDTLVTPEGPVALDDGSVLVVEILLGRLTRVSPDGRTDVVATLGGGPNGAAIGPDGACYVANNGGFATEVVNGRREMRLGLPEGYRGGYIQRVDLQSGAVTTLYSATPDAPLRGPNDLVFDGTGGFWFTDLGKMTEAAVDFGSIYWAAADGSAIRRVDRQLLTPNGIALSPDRRTLYVALTEPRQIVAYDLTGPGQVATGPGGRPRRRILASVGGDVAFDSMAVEESGNLVVGTFRTGALTVFSPTGAIVERVPFADGVTNIALGGQDRRTAFVTITQSGKLLSLPWPRRGLKLAHR